MPKRDDRTEPKRAALFQEGTLNPSPEKVGDPKFQGSEFFDPRDLVQVRYEMLRRVSVDEASVTQAASEYGVSRPTYYQTKTSFDEAGVAGLVPKKRGPRGPHKLQGKVLAFVETQLVEGEPIRARELAQKIRRKFSITVHPRTIERAIRGKKRCRKRPHGNRESLGEGKSDRALRNVTSRRSGRVVTARGKKRSGALSSTRHVGLGAGGGRSALDTGAAAILTSALARQRGLPHRGSPLRRDGAEGHESEGL